MFQKIRPPPKKNPTAKKNSKHYLFSISIFVKIILQNFKNVVPPTKEFTRPGKKFKNISSQNQFYQNEKKVVFTPQIVIPGWTAGGDYALWVSEYPLCRTRYLANWLVMFV